jgi:hypothetical protein
MLHGRPEVWIRFDSQIKNAIKKIVPEFLNIPQDLNVTQAF